VEAFPEAEAGCSGYLVSGDEDVCKGGRYTHSIAAPEIDYDLEIRPRCAETGICEKSQVLLVRFDGISRKEVIDLFQE
jgi:hypothetical protein